MDGPLSVPWQWWKTRSVSQQYQPGISIMKNSKGHLVPSTGHQAVSIKQRVFSCFSGNYFTQIHYNDQLNKIIWKYRFWKKKRNPKTKYKWWLPASSTSKALHKHWQIGTTPKIRIRNSRMFEPEFYDQNFKQKAICNKINVGWQWFISLIRHQAKLIELGSKRKYWKWEPQKIMLVR